LIVNRSSDGADRAARKRFCEFEKTQRWRERCSQVVSETCGARTS
jgi:hypothetical protein